MLFRSQNGLQPTQVFIAQGAVGGLVHIVGVGGALGVDVEHDPAVKAVGGGKALHTFQGGVQCAGLGGAGVDANAYQRVGANAAQYVTVRLICMRLVIPDAARIFIGLEYGNLFGLNG